jgi:hypothetical protein
MHGSNKHYVVALGAVILALSLSAQGLASPSKPSPQAEAENAAATSTQTPLPAAKSGPNNSTASDDICGQYPQKINSPDCASIRSAKATEIQAVATRDQVQLGLIQAIGLWLSIFVTMAATVYAAKAAKAAAQATEVIPLLERAYVYAIIETENVAATLDHVKRLKATNQVAKGAPVATVVFKNFGKTPAILVGGEVWMGLIGVTRVGNTTDLPIKYRYVLGEGEESDPFNVTLDPPLTRDEALQIESGRCGLYIGGFLTYRDIWGCDHPCHVRFSYNPGLKRLDSQVRPERKPEHSFLSKLLPSLHWLDDISG